MDRIDFSLSPETLFDHNGTLVSYTQFYSIRYKQTINDLNQPLLITKCSKTGEDKVLIPELCQLSTFADLKPIDFRLMKVVDK